MRNNQWLLGIDIGTTAIKVGLYDLNGKTEKVYSERNQVENIYPGWAEQDMEKIWIKVCKLLKRITGKTKAKDILSIGLSGQSGGLWLVDKNLNPTGKGVTWLDLRGAEIISQMDSMSITELYKISGWKPFPGSGPILLKWFDIHQPKMLQESKFLLRCKDWVRLKLTDEVASDPTDMIGFIDPETGKYSSKIFQILNLDESYIELLPSLKKPWEKAGEVTRQAAKETGLMEGTPVIVGAYDVCSSALGAGVIKPGQMLSIIGTAGIYAAISDKVIKDPQMKVSVNLHCVPSRYVLNSQSMLATPNIDWFISEFCKDLMREYKGKKIYEVCDKLVETVEPSSGFIIYHPYLQGEMSPIMNPYARGSFFGLSIWHKRENILRSIYEGVGYSMLDNILQLSKFVTAGEEVTVIGGGSKSQVWLKILSDICGLRIKVPVGEEFGCRGAAINAGLGIGVFKSHEEALKSLLKTRFLITPTQKHTELYKRLFKIYQEFYKRVEDLWSELEEIRKFYYETAENKEVKP
jgi:sugar (pentulose or hexulose) kinase